MYNYSSSPTVQNNTINGGSGPTSSAMYNNNSPSIIVQNNILLTHTGAGSVCFFEGDAVSDPQSMRNNNLFACQVVYYDSDGGCTGNADGDNNSNTCTLAEMNALTDITSGMNGNVSADPQFVDQVGGDWHFSAGSPASVTQGGLNGIDEGWSFTNDKDGVARPASGSPWAIGAYEP